MVEIQINICSFLFGKPAATIQPNAVPVICGPAGFVAFFLEL